MRNVARNLVLTFFMSCLVSASQAQAQSGIKENLDLPFDALGEDEEEEDAPEVVNFFTVTLEGDGFFYVIDRSGSMQDSGELAKAKQEVIKNLNEFSDSVEYGIVFFAADVQKFPSSGQPAQADPAGKQSGKSFVQATTGSSGSCCLQGIQAALQIANRAKARRKVLTYLGDGGGTCMGADESQYLNKALSTVAGMNFQRVKINTIGVLQVSAIGEQFLRKLAAMNGGTYTKI
jgi:hypothetical protein